MTAFTPEQRADLKRLAEAAKPKRSVWKDRRSLTMTDSKLATAEDEKRLEDIRTTYYGGVYGNSPGAVDVPWLLDRLSERDARIAKLEAALSEIFCGPGGTLRR